MEPIVNRVAESQIDVFNLDDFWDGKPVVSFDIAPFLYEGLILREKEFRAEVAEHDWSQYVDKHVAIDCSADAIVPTWASMLVATMLEPHAASVAHGSASDLIRDHYARELGAFEWSQYEDKIVVIKGCGGSTVPQAAYVAATTQLKKVARKVMFGEPCSSVPLWRKPRAAKASTASVKAAVKPA